MAKLKIKRKTADIITVTYPANVDLNGDTLFLTIKKKIGGAEDDSDAVIQLTTTVSTSTNVAQFPYNATQSDKRACDSYVADLRRLVGGTEPKNSDYFDVEIEETVGQRSS